MYTLRGVQRTTMRVDYEDYKMYKRKIEQTFVDDEDENEDETENNEH